MKKRLTACLLSGALSLTGCIPTTIESPAKADNFITGTGCEAFTDDLADAYFDNLIATAPAFANPPVVDFADRGYGRAVMELRYRQFNIAGCNAELRAYYGGWSNEDRRRVGYERPAYPTMRIRPGQTYRSLIVNNLPSNTTDLPDKSESLRRHDGVMFHKKFGGHGGASTVRGYLAPDTPIKEPNIPHDFNVTNMHTHGWHVSPVGNSDNVLLAIPPRAEQEEFRHDHIHHQVIYLPDDHVAGTFWYHPHKHGSTTIQVGSGMAGTLQVVDERRGLDAIAQIRRAADHIFVLQQVGYGTDGLIENYDNLQEAPFNALNRPTLVNGQVYPKLRVKVDEVQRWRFVHAGVTAGINPTLVDKNFACTTTAIANQSDFSSALPQRQIAFDGIPTGNDVAVDIARLFPGYRVDVLVKFAADTIDVGDELLLVDANRACMNAGSNGAPNWRSARYVLAQIEVVAGRAPATELPSAGALQQARADYAYPGGPIEPLTPADLDAPANFIHFAAESLARGATALSYHCPLDGGNCEPCDSNHRTPSGQTCGTKADYDNATEKTNYWYIDAQGNKVAAGNYMVCDLFARGENTGQWGACATFNPAEAYARRLTLNTASAWYVSSQGPNAQHVFHIHVNPFQVKRRFVDGSSGDIGEQWVWKDTLLAPDVTRQTNATKAQLTSLRDETAYLLSRYTVYTGAFVQHCHVLNHEDQGMMQIVEVEPREFP